MGVKQGVVYRITEKEGEKGPLLFVWGFGTAC